MSETTNISDEQLIDDFKKHKNQAIEAFYMKGRGAFMKWALKNFTYGEADVMDIYQDAIIIFYENVLSGKYIPGRSSIKTYLYGIAKNLFFKKMERAKKITMIAHDPMDPAMDYMDYAEVEIESDDRAKAAHKAFATLKGHCKDILTLFYYHKLSMGDIAKKLGYKSDKVVKSQKVRCLKSLKDETLKYLSYD